MAAEAEPGRAAAALPRAPGAHEPGGATASLSRGGGALRALDAAASLRHARADLPLADPRPERSRLRRMDASGSRVRGSPVVSPGPRDPGAHPPGRALGAGRLLSGTGAGGGAPLPVAAPGPVWYPSSVRIIAVILAGGRGERFWPLSRRSRPKQFL